MHFLEPWQKFWMQQLAVMNFPLSKDRKSKSYQLNHFKQCSQVWGNVIQETFCCWLPVFCAFCTVGGSSPSSSSRCVYIHVQIHVLQTGWEGGGKWGVRIRSSIDFLHLRWSCLGAVTVEVNLFKSSQWLCDEEMRL